VTTFFVYFPKTLNYMQNCDEGDCDDILPRTYHNTVSVCVHVLNG